eukprot:15287328-Ditylum_brightwellii.AAC.2
MASNSVIPFSVMIPHKSPPHRIGLNRQIQMQQGGNCGIRQYGKYCAMKIHSSKPLWGHGHIQAHIGKSALLQTTLQSM